MNDLSSRQQEMRRRYQPSLGAGAGRAEKKRGRPLKMRDLMLASSTPKQRKSSECEIGYHYLDCPDLNCSCTCHNDECKGESQA